jgi:hypothetical protein
VEKQARGAIIGKHGKSGCGRGASKLFLESSKTLSTTCGLGETAPPEEATFLPRSAALRAFAVNLLTGMHGSVEEMRIGNHGKS